MLLTVVLRSVIIVVLTMGDFQNYDYDLDFQIGTFSGKDSKPPDFSAFVGGGLAALAVAQCAIQNYNSS